MNKTPKPGNSVSQRKQRRFKSSTQNFILARKSCSSWVVYFNKNRDLLFFGGIPTWYLPRGSPVVSPSQIEV